jgi:DNA-directed RNA polymerase specialized sigma24 family protein
MKRVIESELTPLQRETIIAYYFQQKNICCIARERGVHKSTVCRTLHRAEARVRRHLKY